jgi:hypothetical protein
LAKCGRQGFEQLKGTGHPGLETRRRFCNPLHHFSASCIDGQTARKAFYVRQTRRDPRPPG